jgi:adenylate cyclase
MKKRTLFLLIPMGVVLILSLLNLTPFLQTAEKRVFDTLLHIKPAPPEHGRICIIGIDDPAIDDAGPWPWPRDILADGLITMKELGARYSVFDIEYINPSLRTVDPARLTQLKETTNKEFSNINAAIEYLFDLLRSQKISFQTFQEHAAQESAVSRDEILKGVDTVARNNDDYLGRCAALFVSSYFTVNVWHEHDNTVSDEERRYVLDHIVLKNIEDFGSYPHTTPEIKPTILPILRGAKGAGFTEVVVDKDGVQRSISLLVKYRDAFLPQVAFSPLLDWLGNPKVEVYPDHLVLRGARIPGDGNESAPTDIHIPFNEEGYFLINWLHKPFLQSFKQISYSAFIDYEKYQKELRNALEIMNANGYLAFYRGRLDPLAALARADGLKQDILYHEADPGLMSDYTAIREQVFNETGEFLSTADKEFIRQLDDALAAEKDPAGRKELEDYKKGVASDFEQTRIIYDNFMKVRGLIREAIGESFCLIGLTSTATTDIGVTPFDEKYMNVGTHASTVNTILTQSFLDNLPWWYSAILALVLSVGSGYLLYILKKPLLSIIVGAGVVIAIILLLGAFFIITSVYLNVLTPTIAVFFTFIVLTFLNFLETAREKTYIRSAFSRYLSTDVINELILDPSKLNLGGEEKRLTAMFTDVKGFSSISEQLTPSDLVKLLNSYLTEMSDIVLELHGTIDKYEGDAIICFFGAPIAYEDHAHRACRAAVHMKKAEQQLNARLSKDNLSPGPLLTRIGINTGEMVVGNMGTANKMDYTIMGNSVNLASRLEGVNKIYGTWTIMSENTHNECGTEFITRKLDRVRVVNIKQPVRLYELIDEKGEADPKLREALDIFHAALELFEKREWDAAQKRFKETDRLLPGDGPSAFFSKRCAQYKRKGPEKDWDGVFNLTTK